MRSDMTTFKLLYEIIDIFQIYALNCMSHYKQKINTFQETQLFVVHAAEVLFRAMSHKSLSEIQIKVAIICHYLLVFHFMHILDSLNNCLQFTFMLYVPTGDICVCLRILMYSRKWNRAWLRKNEKEERRGTENKELRDYYTFGINEGHKKTNFPRYLIYIISLISGTHYGTGTHSPLHVS